MAKKKKRNETNLLFKKVLYSHKYDKKRENTLN